MNVATGGLRCFYLDATLAQGVCYVDGERHAFGADLVPCVVALCDHDTLTASLLAAALSHPEFASKLTEWVNAGFWYFND